MTYNISTRWLIWLSAVWNWVCSYIWPHQVQLFASGKNVGEWLRTTMMKDRLHFGIHVPILGCHSGHESHQPSKPFAVKTKRLLVDHYNSNDKNNTVLPKLSSRLYQTVNYNRQTDRQMDEQISCGSHQRYMLMKLVLNATETRTQMQQQCIFCCGFPFLWTRGCQQNRHHHGGQTASLKLRHQRGNSSPNVKLIERKKYLHK